MQPTETLVEASRAGDKSAVTQLVQRYEHAAIMAAWSVVGDFHLAEDVAQESLVEAFRQLTQLRNSKSFGPWLLTNVRRRANRRRTRRPAEQPGLELHEFVPNRECWSDQFEELLPMLSQLPEQEFTVVSLRHISGMSIKQIAVETGKPVGTVSKQLSRAIQRLRSIVAEVE